MRLHNPKPIVHGPSAFHCPRHAVDMTLAGRHFIPEKHHQSAFDDVGIGVWACPEGGGYWWEDGFEWFRLTVTP